MFVRTWSEDFTEAMRSSGESWDDIEHTPFNEYSLAMSSNPRDDYGHYVPPEEAAWTKNYVYTILV
jgi:hypothetical protein